MTLIRINRNKPSPEGSIPVGGVFEFTPTKRRVEPSEPDLEILPIPFSVDIPKDTGRADVELTPTGPDWAWQICAHSFGLEREYVYVLVPEPVADPNNPGKYLPVDFTDLIRVFKSSLKTALTPSPIWWAELEAAKALAADVETARAEAAESAQAALAAGYSATPSPAYPGALRIFYPVSISPRPLVVRIPIGENQ